MEWIRKVEHLMNNYSIIWNVFIRVLGWICKSLSWKDENGKAVKFGIDPVIGMEETFILSRSLTSYLQDCGISTLDHGQSLGDWSTNGAYWLMAKDLELRG